MIINQIKQTQLLYLKKKKTGRMIPQMGEFCAEELQCMPTVLS